MKTSDVLANHLISFMEKQEDIWYSKDTDSRIIYANKTVLNTSGLPMNFNIEGKKISECPVSWTEHVEATHAYEQIVIQSEKPIFIINTRFVAKEQVVQSFIIEKIPYHNKNKIMGTICHGRKIPPQLLSEHFFKNPNTPSFLTNNPPNDLFTTEELNMLFFRYETYEYSRNRIAVRYLLLCCRANDTKDI
uniref:PAS fold-4 domain-containing protein n=1 Tax=Arsenophonus endosymbiont of Trialeurodes vaporariorum TaxID=235567 RepID=A0A3B0MQ20_9GAMM